eukprot:CAMPEP_0180234902 /NCGR_PEP_ID=MMETSP0987-20121128/28924_1 /TAXON_ID=697907 /ORGANISM="non described non described, Strain CCMP2293" /LENGTH=127 /DNA_ID=CAMNT_0022200953 /DNA_START=274 /DNA_END=654 /DNA_ORIENTATION=-
MNNILNSVNTYMRYTWEMKPSVAAAMAASASSSPSKTGSGDGCGAQVEATVSGGRASSSSSIPFSSLSSATCSASWRKEVVYLVPFFINDVDPCKRDEDMDTDADADALVPSLRLFIVSSIFSPPSL